MVVEWSKKVESEPEETLEDKLCKRLGFRIKDNQIQTYMTRYSELTKQNHPAGVRPASMQEIALWNLLLNYAKQVEGEVDAV